MGCTCKAGQPKCGFCRQLDEARELVAVESNGLWVAYYSDLSDFAVFRTEIEALRYAVEKSMSVKAFVLPFTRDKLLAK